MFVCFCALQWPLQFIFLLTKSKKIVIVYLNIVNYYFVPPSKMTQRYFETIRKLIYLNIASVKCILMNDCQLHQMIFLQISYRHYPYGICSTNNLYGFLLFTNSSSVCIYCLLIHWYLWHMIHSIHLHTKDRQRRRVKESSRTWHAIAAFFM